MSDPRPILNRDPTVVKAARAEYRDAVEKGVLTPAKFCAECGRTGRIEGHHWDYSQPLLVDWLCPKCHANAHKRSDRFPDISVRARVICPRCRSVIWRREVLELGMEVEVVDGQVAHRVCREWALRRLARKQARAARIGRQEGPTQGEHRTNTAA